MDGMRKPNALAAGFYLLTNLVTGIFWFTLSVVLIVVGLATSVLWVGLPILWLAMNVVRGGATIERAWVRAALRTDIPSPSTSASRQPCRQRPASARHNGSGAAGACAHATSLAMAYSPHT